MLSLRATGSIKGGFLSKYSVTLKRPLGVCAPSGTSTLEITPYFLNIFIVFECIRKRTERERGTTRRDSTSLSRLDLFPRFPNPNRRSLRRLRPLFPVVPCITNADG